MRSLMPIVPLVLGFALLGSCAALGSLNQVVQAPRVSVARGVEPEIRLLGPSAQRPLGGASIRLWANIANPNPVGITLSMLQGDLALEGVNAADVSFPLGLPLAASQETVIPLDIAVSFSQLPRLAELIPRSLGQGRVAYRLNGTLGVDAGVLGRPSFGPMLLMEGVIQTR